MSVLKPRTRVIYFRISEDEFSELNRLCRQTGARSLSDMARAAMQALLKDVGTGLDAAVVTRRLDSLERVLSDINEALRTLTTRAGTEDEKEDCSDQVF
jgi:hypothetical protein